MDSPPLLTVVVAAAGMIVLAACTSLDLGIHDPIVDAAPSTPTREAGLLPSSRGDVATNWGDDVVSSDVPKESAPSTQAPSDSASVEDWRATDPSDDETSIDGPLPSDSSSTSALVDCAPQLVSCTEPPPDCPPGFVASVVSGCHGACVAIANSRCAAFGQTDRRSA